MSTIDILNRNWRIVGDRKRSIFQREVGSELNRYISAMSLGNARIVRSMVGSGQLHVLAGTLDHQGIPRLCDGTEIAVGVDSSSIINATGLAPPIKSPFVASLKRNCLVSTNRHGGIITCPETGKAHNKYPIYALGPVTKGSIYTTNFLYSSVRSARAMAKAIFGVSTRQLSLAS